MAKMMLFSLFGIFLLTACNETGEEEFLEYIYGPHAEYRNIEEDLTMMYDEYQTAADLGDDEEMFSIIINDLQPQIELMNNYLQDVQLSHTDNQDLHAMLQAEAQYYLAAINVEEEAFIAAIEDNDQARAEELFQERDEYYEQAYEQSLLFQTRMDVLLQRHEISEEAS
ncbi:hypothetical protein [Natribacillus halophilus]|uniref:Cell-wall binding lipoprotein n=1 Tax=Natribacillus halophilus TaxID=549003 RepID=A0A1G8QBV4_9BACI|nr:hypothetical protein [Natribacillus halophilus]SDJ01935.1 hypothetical protein SAMN04488123_11154 [Natribacillus halophilus]